MAISPSVKPIVKSSPVLELLVSKPSGKSATYVLFLAFLAYLSD